MRVEVPQRLGHLREEPGGAPGVARGSGEQVGALDELHREQPAAALPRDEVAQGHEVRVREVGERAKLTLEAPQAVGVVAAQHLEGHALAARAVERGVDVPRRAAAEPSLDRKALRARGCRASLHRLSPRS